MSRIPATQKVEIRRITVQGQPKQKVAKLHLNVQVRHVGVGLSSQLLRRLWIGGLQSEVLQSHKHKFYLKNN
jgi:hypothetical protein